MVPGNSLSAGGEISFLQDVESTLEGIYGNPVKLPPQLLENKHPLPARVFLARMLNNLKQVLSLRGFLVC